MEAAEQHRESTDSISINLQDLWMEGEGSAVAAAVSGSSAYLEHADVGQAVRPQTAAVDLDVLQPLDVRLRVAEDLALKSHIAAHHRRAVGGQAGLEDGSVGGALWRRRRRLHQGEERVKPGVLQRLLQVFSVISTACWLELEQLGHLVLA